MQHNKEDIELNNDSDILNKRLSNLNLNKPKNKNANIIKPKFKSMAGQTGKIKQFDQNLSDKFDIRSRDIVKECLKDLVDDNPDIYGEDLIVRSKDIPYGYIELQVYGKWDSNNFPYNQPFIYERKMKFCENTLFICFNKSFDEIIIFSRKHVNPKKYRVKKFSREYICYVPWTSVIRVKIEELNLKLIRIYCGLDDPFE